MTQCRILFVGQLPPLPTGAAVLSGHVLAGLAARGYRITALSPLVPRDRQPDRFAAQHPQIDVVRFPMQDTDLSANEGRSGRDPLSLAPGVAAHLPALLDADRPDLIMIGEENSLLAVPPLARAHAVPAIVVVHGLAAAILSDRSVPPGLRQPMREALHGVRLLTVAPHLAQTLRQESFTDVQVIVNGVDPGHFRPGQPDQALRERFGLNTRDRVVLHASNMKPLKRPLDVVDAAALALRREPDLRFLVVGEGACREQMEKACRAHNVDARFHFANWLPYELMADCYRLADIVVMPSEREGMALVYLEAQASGCVLLASDIPAARDAIRDGETGILFPLADAEALADCLVNVVGDRSSATRIGEQARQWIVGNRTLERCVAGYAAAIDSMLR